MNFAHGPEGGAHVAQAKSMLLPKKVQLEDGSTEIYSDELPPRKQRVQPSMRFLSQYI